VDELIASVGNVSNLKELWASCICGHDVV
jgi:hypothetical protein